MTFILESMGLHKNKIFHKLQTGEKIFNLHRLDFDILFSYKSIFFVIFQLLLDVNAKILLLSD